MAEAMKATKIETCLSGVRYAVQDPTTWSGDGEVIAFEDHANAVKCAALMQRVIASERERCAKIAEGCESIAAAIRSGK